MDCPSFLSPSPPTTLFPASFTLLACLVLHPESQMGYFICFLNFSPLHFLDFLFACCCPLQRQPFPELSWGHAAFILVHPFLSVGKEETTAGRQGPGAPRFSSQPWGPWAQSPSWEWAGLGHSAPHEGPCWGWGQCWPPQCAGLGPRSQDAVESARGGRMGSWAGFPEAGAQGRSTRCFGQRRGSEQWGLLPGGLGSQSLTPSEGGLAPGTLRLRDRGSFPGDGLSSPVSRLWQWAF